MGVFVRKADGTRQLFERKKVVKTCLRLGADREAAESIAEKVESSIFEGIETRKIFQMILRLLRRHKAGVKYITDLRKALSLMNPKPDFERFIQVLLSENGYEVTPNQIVRGKCVEHEVDAIARKNGVTYFVEVKHHFNPHTLTSLDISRIARAVLEDVTEGYELGLNNLKIDRAMIITNTKLSEHARRYAECKGLFQIGWNSPSNRGLEYMIEAKQLYPVTYLKDLKRETRNQLGSAGIVLLRHLVETDKEELLKKTGVPIGTLDLMIKRARTVLFK